MEQTPVQIALVWKCRECLNNWPYIGLTVGHTCGYGLTLGLKEHLLCMLPWVISGKSPNFSELHSLIAQWDLTALFYLFIFKGIHLLHASHG